MKATQQRTPSDSAKIGSDNTVDGGPAAIARTAEQQSHGKDVGGVEDWTAFLGPVQLLGAAELQALEPHRLAATMPSMREEELDALREDVRTWGIVSPLIVLPEGGVIDGRHRLLIAKELGLGAPASQFMGGEERAATYVASLNLQRRSLSQSQRTAIALLSDKLVTAVSHGGDRRSGFKGGMLTDAESAKRAGVSVRYWRDGKRLKALCPELLSEVVKGRLTIPMASTRCCGKEHEKSASCGCDRSCESDQCPWRSTRAELEASKQLVLKLRQQLAMLAR